MKKILLAIFALSLAMTSVVAKGFEKKGFLTTKACAKVGAFKDCSLDSFSCGYEGCFLDTEVGVETKTELVLFVHDDGKYYNIDASSFHRSELDEGSSRNEVTIVGEYNKNSNTIIVQEFKAPPPPKKSFFKGCL
jgi:hypothetical protein